MKKSMSLILSILMVLFVFSGCATKISPTVSSTAESSGANTADPVKITLWNCDGGPFFQDPLVKFAETFMDQNKDIEVEIVGLPYESYPEKFNIAIASNTAPDIGYIEPFVLRGFYDQGGLVDLTPYIEKSHLKDEIPADIFNIVSFNKEIICLPAEVVGVAMYYRDDIVKANAQKYPNNWDDFFKLIENCTNPATGVYGYYMYGTYAVNHLTSELAAYAGVDKYIGDDGKCFVRDPAVLECMTKLAGIYGKFSAKSDITGKDMDALVAFNTGTAAAFCGAFASYNLLVEQLGVEKVHATLLPTAKNGITTLVANVCGFTMFSDSQNRDEAWRFMEFLSSEEQNSTWCENLGVLPPNQKAAAHSWTDANPCLVAYREALKNPKTVVIKIPFDLPQYTDISVNVIDSGFQDVLTGKTTPAAFLDAWATAIEEAYATK